MQTTSILTHPASRAQAVINAAEMYLSAPERLLFSSNDLDEVRSMVGRVMKPHRLQLASDTERLNARMHYIILGNTSISRLRYGATVQIDAGALKDFFLVQIPLCGTAVIESGGQRIESCQELASVLSPDHETRMIWRSGNDQILLKVSRALLERTLIGHLGRPLDTPLRFQLGFQWRDSASWCGMLSYLLDCAVQYPNLDQHKIVLNQIEQLCASILLTSHEHNYSCSQPVRRNTILPRHVRRAQDYMQAHAHEPMSVDQLAQIAGVSVRGLYTGFREFLNVSPMNYLRDLRMERVRTELMAGDASSVASVALRWGFAHMGRFGNDYKKRYGETPSQTLRRC